jgi:hypothetical protein
VTESTNIVGATVRWDEEYPIVNLFIPANHWDEMVAIPSDLAARYAEAHAAWRQVQRDLKRYLRALDEVTTCTPSSS